jgi:MoxR-like ATPase
LRGRPYALPVDIADVAVDVLAHRLILTYDAIADGVPTRRLVERVLERVGQPSITPSQLEGAA